MLDDSVGMILARISEKEYCFNNRDDTTIGGQIKPERKVKFRQFDESLSAI